MTTVLVWSEKPDPVKVTDCTYSSGLMGMAHAGYVAFPLGTYTVAEREALERSDAQPDHTGASLDDVASAIKSRYGKVVTVSPSSALPALLDTPGLALAVQGYLSAFPVGNRLRRWQVNFTGGHCVCVVNEGAGKYRWLDPLAPMRFAGDIVLKNDVIRYAERLGQSIPFKAGQFAPPVPKLYTQAEMDAVLDKLAKANADLAACRTALAAANARIAAAKAALGG